MAKKKMNKDKNKGNNDNASLDQQADEASRLDAKSDDDFEQAKEAEAIEAAPLAIEQTVEATEAAKPVEPPKSDKPDESAKSERKRRPWFSAFNFLLILCLAAAG
ncbi:MAG: hypothetical protein ACI9LO_002344, partial [Planctomycetota bacterium]